MEKPKKTTFPSEVIHFTMTVAGVGACIDDAFSDALRRLNDDPCAAIYGEVEYAAHTQTGSLQVCPTDDEAMIQASKIFGTEEAEA